MSLIKRMSGGVEWAIPRTLSGVFGGVLLVLLLSVCATVHAQPQLVRNEHTDDPFLPVRIDAHAALTWDGELALGGRTDIPIVEKGFLSSTRDELSISVGLDVAFVSFSGSNPLTFWPTGTIQWSLGVSDHFTFYPEFGLAGQIARDGWGGVFPNIGFGGRYSLYRSASITARLGWPMALSLGASF